MIHFKKILIIAAHPDDDVLGCGGYIAKCIQQNSRVMILFVGEGSTCRFSSDKINSPEAQQAIQQRQHCSIQSLTILGVTEYLFGNFPCGRFDQVPLLDMGKKIEKIIHDFQPDAIFTHHEFDVNRDHQIVFQATLQATRPSAQNNVPFLFSYEVLSSTEWRFTNSFKPNFFVNIEETVNIKICALEAYATEIKSYPFPRSQEGIKVLAQYRGMQVGYLFAEAFQLIRGYIT